MFEIIYSRGIYDPEHTIDVFKITSLMISSQKNIKKIRLRRHDKEDLILERRF